MRKYKSSIIALSVLLICILAYFAVDNMSGKNHNTDKNRETVLSIKESDIQAIEFENSDESFVLKKENGKFSVAGEKAAMNENEITQLIKSISEIDGRLISENCTDKSVYGLDSPTAAVKIVTKSGAREILLGALTPAQTEYYVLSDDGGLYSVYKGAGSAIATKKWQLIDTSLFSAKYEDITKIAVEGENSYTAERQSSGIWRISSQIDGDYEAEDDKVRAELGLYLENMYAKRMYSNSEAKRTEYGLEEPEAVVYIKDKNGEETKFSVSRNQSEKETAVIKNDGDDIYITIESYFGMLDMKKEDIT